MDKPFAPSAEKNKDAILALLTQELADARTVLEIGSGTGQHAVHFARALAHVTWQPSDLPAQQIGIGLWRAEARLENLLPPLVLDVSESGWTTASFDAVYSANTVHYMPWSAVDTMLEGVARALAQDGRFLLYGPFNYHGAYISDGNRQLDVWLKEQNPEFAIRDIAEVTAQAAKHGLRLRHDYAMPANNRLLSWQRD